MLKKPPKPDGYELFGPTPTFPDVPYAEWKSRIDKVQRLMRETDVDLLMLWNDKNIRYFTGFTSVHWNMPSIQLLVALIPADGEPTIIASEFFRWTVEGQSWIRDIRCPVGGDEHSEKLQRHFPEVVSSVVGDLGYDKSTIALEMGETGYMYIPRPLNDILALMNNLPKAQFVNGDELIWDCRRIKSSLEIERLKMAVDIHRQALSAVVQNFRPGMTEADVGNLFICEAFQQGAELVVPGHIACGNAKEGMLDTKHSFDGVTIQRNDTMQIDLFLSYKGYWADMGRVLAVGPLSDEFKTFSEQARQAFDTVVEQIKPGMTVKELNYLLYEAGGMETEGEMAGHGIGLDIHEPPMLCVDSDAVLEVGMTLEIEAFVMHGFRKQGGEGLIHYENLVIITDDGCTPIISLDRDIIQVAYPFA
jgi:Xaa-Pro aminopeptidase